MRLSPGRVIVGVVAAAGILVAISPMTRAAIHTVSGTPTPIPTPVNASITLDTAAGVATTKITAIGSSFNPNQPMNLYWDTPDHVAGAVTSDGNGAFTKPSLTPFPGDKPGLHRLCASVPPHPCANFTLLGPPSPTPATSPPPDSSPSPSDSPSPSASSTRTVAPPDDSTTGLNIILRPPFVFFPIIAILGILGALAYWALSSVQRSPRPIPSASVVHRSARPDMGPIGVAAPAPPPASTEPPEPPPPPTMHPPPPGLPPPAPPETGEVTAEPPG